MSKTEKSAAMSRRQLIARIGLGAGVAYVAPVMMGMHAARASGNSAPSGRSAPSPASPPSRRSAPSPASPPSRRSAPSPASRQSAPSPASRQSAPSRRSSPSRPANSTRRSLPSNMSAPSSIRLTQRELDNCQRVQNGQRAGEKQPIWVLRALDLC